MDQILNSTDNQTDNYYTLLGCDQSSSEEQIQAEYKVRALQLHPDKNPGDPEAEAKFQQLQVAKDTLTDPERRVQYDRWLSSGLTISFQTWCGMKQQMATTMHWATPNTKDRMVEPSSSQGGPPKPGARRSSEQIQVTRPAEGWERDSSDVIRKFRNYEI